MTQDATHRLDDKYTTGVWYDTYNSNFCTIQRGFDPDAPEDGRIVELVNPETDDIYWDMPVREWDEDILGCNFRPVSDLAVDDPVAVVNRAVRILRRNDINELSSLPDSFSTDLSYAMQQVEISEK